ncbi:hypothetical protein GCM10010493_67180 [Streptomyces lavendulae subsp. grasserius]
MQQVVQDLAGSDVHPEFDRAAVLGWLLAHGKIEMPTRTPAGALLMARPVVARGRAGWTTRS